MRQVALGLVAVAAIALGGAGNAPITAADVPQTKITSAAALTRLLNNTGVTLQWNWGSTPGPLSVEASAGFLALHGEQHDNHGGTLSIEGVVTELDATVLMFKGRIALHDAEATVDCVRDGEYTFRIVGGRKFWRMKEQEAHCPGREDLTDYVDIHFK